MKRIIHTYTHIIYLCVCVYICTHIYIYELGYFRELKLSVVHNAVKYWAVLSVFLSLSVFLLGTFYEVASIVWGRQASK